MQKTAYEVRISDWSSDVCSSDLDQPLRRGFLVAGGAVDLAGEEQAGEGAGFQRVLQSPRVEEVVLDRVAGAGDVRVLEAADRAIGRATCRGRACQYG